jgi:hypothetical protein
MENNYEICSCVVAIRYESELKAKKCSSDYGCGKLISKKELEKYE